MLWQTVFAAEFEGVAPVGLDGLAVARPLAIQDALENAALFNGAKVQSQAVKKGTQWGETTQLTGTPQGDYKLLREWQSNGFLHVVVDVAPPAPKIEPTVVTKTAGRTAALNCDNGGYRRKVLISYFWIEHPAQTQDLDRFPEGIQIELVRRLNDSDQFLPVRSPGVAVFDLQPQVFDPLIQPERVREMARLYSTQFIVAGIVRDTSFSGERYTVAYGNEIRNGERKTVSSLPILNFAQVGVKAVPAARRFDMDLFVFDGVSGALVNRHRLAGKASGEVVQSLSSGLGTEGFSETAYGQLVDSKLQEATVLVGKDLNCIPFSAKIIRVEKNAVYIDAGYTSNVRPGDTFQVFRISPIAMPIDSASYLPSMRLGMPEEKVGVYTVSQVQPLFAQGTVQGVRVEPGDYVRYVGQER
nr:flagella assembly protein FlgT middle domain-containing protein [uncultured Deefgea sp.]